MLKVWAKGELGMLDLSPGDLKFIVANLASIRLGMEHPTAGRRRAVMRPTICSSCRTVMKKTDLDLIGMFKASDGSCALSFGENLEPWGKGEIMRMRMRGKEYPHCSMALSSSLKLTSREAVAISSYVRRRQCWRC
jgi:hypothetical protein